MKPDLQSQEQPFITMLTRIAVSCSFSLAVASASPVSGTVVRTAKGIYVVSVQNFSSSERNDTMFGNLLRNFELTVDVDETAWGEIEKGATVEITGIQATPKNQLARRYEGGPGHTLWASFGYWSGFRDYRVGERFIVGSMGSARTPGIANPALLLEWDPITMEDILSARRGGDALLAGNEAECTGLRILALAANLREEVKPEEKLRFTAAIRAYLKVCRPEDLQTVISELSDEVWVPVAAAAKYRNQPGDLTEEKALLAMALYECASRLPDKTLEDGKTRSILKRHESGGAALGKADLTRAGAEGNSRADAMMERWFSID